MWVQERQCSGYSPQSSSSAADACARSPPELLGNATPANRDKHAHTTHLQSLSRRPDAHHHHHHIFIQGSCGRGCAVVNPLRERFNPTCVIPRVLGDGGWWVGGGERRLTRGLGGGLSFLSRLSEGVGVHRKVDDCQGFGFFFRNVGHTFLVLRSCVALLLIASSYVWALKVQDYVHKSI